HFTLRVMETQARRIETESAGGEQCACAGFRIGQEIFVPMRVNPRRIAFVPRAHRTLAIAEESGEIREVIAPELLAGEVVLEAAPRGFERIAHAMHDARAGQH